MQEFAKTNQNPTAKWWQFAPPLGCGTLCLRRTIRTFALILFTLSEIFIQPVSAQVGEYCQFENEAIASKDKLRIKALQNSDRPDPTTLKEYQSIVQRHRQTLNTCRQKSWLKTQGIWLRLYPCDLQAGKLEEIMDRMVNRGYNQVFVEVISDGKILLPQSENFTAWDSLVQSEKYKNADLLKLAIAKGKERGLKVHAWLFTMNVSKGYGQGFDLTGLSRQTVARQQAIARNGYGDNTISIIENLGKNPEREVPTKDQLFIDPYNYQAQKDLYLAVNEVIKRQPDGVAFDYVRYKRGAGSASVVSNVRYLWIYGEASLRALRDRAENLQGLEIIQRFVKQGFITPNDLKIAKTRYPQESEPLWQGRRPSPDKPAIAFWQGELWRLAVNHAFIGVIYYLDSIAKPVFRQGIPASIAFFSDGNQPVGNGFDSRMQPWHLFSNKYEWRPMAYAVCNKPDCIVAQVRRVTQLAPAGTQVAPILVGQWGEPFSNRPSLESQMQAIRTAVPTINSISHFAFGWQKRELAFTRSRQFCKL
ncbi:family 10 glycosylhydrolase [Pseudanabaena sp. FACHB-1998]|uniref:family 10 glycosylhydrolase n=1 Tax=Pseudanabaena sp. FACHB-1998 TaxID=2692858 RepID=UPI001680A0C6|nr:family 10 glycosylhydrolase [Pseudanabaena sp. FACHB-1998]MBD2176476.1 family 10 glycosylhydrolase [Pseudanabaena sp. FACHB-1998]